MRFNHKYSVRVQKRFTSSCLSGTGIGKSAKRRRCHVADATSDTVKLLEMENITELWALGRGGEGERGGCLYRQVMLRSTSPSGYDPLFIRERTMHLRERLRLNEKEVWNSVVLHRDTRRHQERLNIFLFRNPATRYLVTFSRRKANALTRIAMAHLGISLLLRHDPVLRGIRYCTRMRRFRSNANYDSGSSIGHFKEIKVAVTSRSTSN